MDLAFLEERWLPKSVLCLRGYTSHKFLHDLLAGVTVGLVALPLAMAFSIASGLTPQAGIYCAMVTGFLVSLLGGSKTQIGGPTGAFVVVVHSYKDYSAAMRHKLILEISQNETLLKQALARSPQKSLLVKTAASPAAAMLAFTRSYRASAASTLA